MARKSTAGELRTRITAYNAPHTGTRDEDGYPVTEPVNVFGEGGFRMCKWVNAHGSEIYTAKQVGIEEPATLTLRYTAKMTTTCLIYRGNDPDPYEVISLNDVENRHVWLEIKVQRKSVAK